MLDVVIVVKCCLILIVLCYVDVDMVLISLECFFVE